MKARPFRSGWGWSGLALYVAGYDTWALTRKRDTLSTVFARSIEHPIRRWPVLAIVTLTLLHLFGRLPTRMDPFHGYAEALRVLDRSRTRV